MGCPQGHVGVGGSPWALSLGPLWVVSGWGWKWDVGKDGMDGGVRSRPYLLMEL